MGYKIEETAMWNAFVLSWEILRWSEMILRGHSFLDKNIKNMVIGFFEKYRDISYEYESWVDRYVMMI